MRGLKRLLRGPVAQDPPAPGALRVLMVCMGNICRSPMAEGVLRTKLRQAGLEPRVVVDSAGTHGHHHGEAPDPRAMRGRSGRRTSAVSTGCWRWTRTTCRGCAAASPMAPSRASGC